MTLYSPRERRADWLTDELAMLSDLVARFAREFLDPHRKDWEAAQIVPRGIWRSCGDAGLLLASIPPEYGGAGGTAAHDIVIQQRLARSGHGSGIGLGICVHSAIVAHYVLAFGTEEQKRRWLPSMACGERIAAIAMTEPGTGSDLRSIRTAARRDGDSFRISGAKTFISNGQNADLILAAVRTAPNDSDGGGLSLVMIEVDGGPGFRRGRNLSKIGAHAQDTSELFFDDLAVPALNVLGGVEGCGFAQLTGQLPWERLLIAVVAVATMDRALEETIAYARERHAFGRPISEFQNTRFQLAECATAARVTSEFVNGCVARYLEGTLDGATAAMAKFWATEQGFSVIDSCLQMFGGYGCMTEYPIARLWGDARISRIYGGTSEIMKSIVARSVLEGV